MLKYLYVMPSFDFLGLTALLFSGLGLLSSVLAYKRPDGRTFLYNRSELPAVARRSARRHRWAMAGFTAVALGFFIQLVAQLAH